jgi:hypothetical protein
MDNFGIYVNLVLLFFPAFSIAYPLTGIYFQSRILGLPFLFKKILKIDENLYLFTLPLVVSIIIPILGLTSNRNPSLIDIGYILSFAYLIVFVQSMGERPKQFIVFLQVFTISNIIYAIFQIMLCNLGIAALSMIHSNVPLQVDAGYVIPPSSSIPYIYRFSGLFNESSPCIFYFSSIAVFLDAIKTEEYISFKDRNITIFVVLLMIAIADSKFAYAFLVMFLTGKISLALKIGYLKTIFNFFGAFTFLAYIVSNYSNIISYLFVTLPAFGDRYSDMESSFFRSQNFFGSGFVSTASSNSDVAGLDAISIVLGGYGFLCGIAVLFTFLMWIFKIRPPRMGNFIVVYLLGLASSGSFLVSQYTLLFTMIYVTHKINGSLAHIPLVEKAIGELE